MSAGPTFTELIRQVRAGDEAAAAELVRQYESAIRRSARLRLGQRLRRAVDSLDVSQAVLASFFVRVASGQYELETPEQLLKLLSTMLRNKVSKLVRHETAERRDQRRVEVGAPEDLAFSAQASPSRQVSARELLEQVRGRLSDEERQLVELRQQDVDWAAIADRMGGTPEARRKQLARAVERVAAEVGLEDDGE